MFVNHKKSPMSFKDITHEELFEISSLREVFELQPEKGKFNYRK